MRSVRYNLTILFTITILCSYAHAQTEVIFGAAYCGSTGPSTLFSIDPVTGTATEIGPVGFERCGGMDFNSEGNLFATCERADGSNTPVLVEINSETGVGAEVGPTGISGAIADVSFRNSDGVLYAYDASNDPGHTIFTIDPQTGIATLVGDTGLSFAGGNGMTFNLADILFQSQLSSGPEPDLNIINQFTGAATFVTQLTSSNTPPGISQYRLSALDADPITGLIFGIANAGPGGGSGPQYLVTLDTGTGIVTFIGQTTDCMDALAIQPTSTPTPTPTANIPALSGWGFIIMPLILLVSAVLVLKYRRRSTEA